MSNQSTKEEKEIQDMILENKSNKEEILLNEEVLKKIIELKESDMSKDDISFEIVVSFKMKPSLFEIHWKSLQQSQSYRDKTIENFLDRILENDLSMVEDYKMKEWCEEMVKGGYLSKSENYKQHFIVYKSLALRKNLMRVKGYKI